MPEPIKMEYEVPGDDFTRAGAASGDVKSVLKKLGLSSQVVRKVAISMYEGEINMVIHGGGGKILVEITPEAVYMSLIDHGPGIEDISLAMKEGWSTAPESVRNLGFGAGMGMPNMKKYSDKMDVHSVVGEGTTVNMTVYIS